MNKSHLKGNSSSIRFIFQAKNKGLKASPPKRKVKNIIYGSFSVLSKRNNQQNVLKLRFLH